MSIKFKNMLKVTSRVAYMDMGTLLLIQLIHASKLISLWSPGHGLGTQNGYLNIVKNQ